MAEGISAAAEEQSAITESLSGASEETSSMADELNKMIDNGLVKSNNPIVYYITSKGLEARLNRGVSTNQTTKKESLFNWSKNKSIPLGSNRSVSCRITKNS